MTIRPAEARDRDGIWAIFYEVVAADEAMRVWLDVPKATYVAEVDARMVGTYYLKDNQPGLGSHVCNAGYMVDAASRGAGVGQAMCEHSLDAARQLGYLAMQYNLVATSNARAVELWQRMGFEVVGTLPKAFRHARLGLVDALVMYRWL